ncbi:MAG: zinc-dependent alcohol dehydrogenase [Candidatus Jordarchaeum sp.]|uniref:zinc-dependent alcohol dehydrogenase n=1 Tax=Candidatus Jordarchaeum sp. TaxID=2823881 RepID=UPI004049DC5C
MKAALFQGPSAKPMFTVEDVERPKPKANEVLVEVEASALCGTDLHILDGTLLSKAYKQPPLIVGHEWAGTVVEVGDSANKFKVGDRVFSSPNFSCGVCTFCLRGRPNLCDRRGVFGLNAPGSNAEYIAAPQESLYFLPDGISFKVGSLIGDTLGTAYHAIIRVQVQPGDVVALWGLGPVGMTIAQMAKIVGASKLIVVDVVPSRLEEISKLGVADFTINGKEKDAVEEIKKLTDGMGADITIEVTGVNLALGQAFDALRKGGKLLLVGTHSKNYDLWSLAVMYREMTIIGTFAHVPTEAEQFVNLVESGRIKLEALISHEFSLDQVNKAFELFIARKTNKVILYPKK